MSTAQEPTLLEESKQLADQTQHLYQRTREENVLGRLYYKNPYAALAITAGAGYIIAGGLMTPFTRRIVKMGMRALVIPLAVAQVKHLTQGAGAQQP